MIINTSVVCVVIMGIVVIVALFVKGDVKASLKVLNAHFTLETRQKK
jgi:hypothetical protein